MKTTRRACAGVCIYCTVPHTTCYNNTVVECMYMYLCNTCVHTHTVCTPPVYHGKKKLLSLATG